MNAMTALKQTIAEAFGKAAGDYDRRACIQKRIASDALIAARQMLSVHQRPACLDVGCGTGSSTIELLPDVSQLTGVDIADGMVQFARRTHGDHINWLVGDAEELPVQDCSTDFIYSCMALQWLDDPEQFARECQRILRDGGQGLLVILTQEALSEFRDIWSENGIPPSVNRFLPAQTWRDALLRHNIQTETKEHEYTDWHDSLISLLHSIKDIGAGVSTTLHSSPLTRGQLRQLESAWKLRFGNHKGLPLTYRVTHFRLKKG